MIFNKVSNECMSTLSFIYEYRIYIINFQLWWVPEGYSTCEMTLLDTNKNLGSFILNTTLLEVS